MAAVKTEERIHHPCSPSQLQVIEASPCFLARQGDSEASRAGTLQHKAFETRDFSRLNDEQAEMTEKCIRYFDQVYAKYAPGAIVINEDYLPVDEEVLFEGFVGTTAGYLDSAIVSADKTEADIVDLKFGKWPVEEASNNLQGIAYLLGLRWKYPTLKKVTVHFVLPYLDFIDVHTFHEPEFQALYLRVRAVVERRKYWLFRHRASASVEYFPTQGSCLFCARIGSCPAVQSIALGVSKKYFPLQVPESLDPLLVDDPSEMGALIKLADLMKLYGESARKQITEEALRQERAPDGYKFVQSTRPSIKSAKAVVEKARALGVKEEVIDEASSITLGPLEEAISQAAPRGQKKKTVTAFREELETEGVVVQGKPFVSLRMITENPVAE